jgi:hypothetical protein
MHGESQMKTASCLASGAALLALTACGAAAPAGRPAASGSAPGVTAVSPAGRVTGVFQRVGGPLGPGGQQPATVRLAGTVRFSSDGRRIDVRVGRSGRFAVSLPAGTYSVAGQTPSIEEQLPSGRVVASWCRQYSPVTIRPGASVRVTVTCAVP